MPPIERIVGFPPIADRSARILILGSMPGDASLAAGEYYAHPRNSFWRILATLLELPAVATYAQRAQALVEAQIALWDVVHSCRRDGSLDAAIEPPSIRTNDFNGFFSSHPDIALVCFNGATAEQLYARRVHGAVGVPAIARQRLPSTSPAHAARSFDDKLDAWRAALDPVLRDGPVRNRRAARAGAATESARCAGRRP